MSCFKFIVVSRLIHGFYLTGKSKDGIPLSNSKTEKTVLLSSEELKKYGGSGRNGKLYLSILGKIFDVTKGKKHYGEGGGYSFFTGRDASRAYVTGDFTETGLIDEVLDLTPQQLKGLQGWLEFYIKEYKYVGKLIGRYYDPMGRKTEYLQQVEEIIKEAQRKERENDAEKRKYPPCNTEWSASKGSRVWCSNKSGGILRDWVGVPRKLYVVGSSTPRCVCVRHPSEKHLDGPSLSDPQLEEYPGCHKDSISCSIKT
ncbi:neuferricin isoform X2 [Ischnura elegans]|uniref:neuferricin isoform X2 n=1 Tax=Ischnura elegans TaxID=197161 RepID=UPI001ED8A8AE|nr:neuferricin isoform X2 [Ischnura elegans]